MVELVKNKRLFNNRLERSKLIFEKYGEMLKGRVLDVGCWERDLKKFLDSNTEYVGIDISGSPDIKVDLEKQKIPFGDNFFDCVVCTDVLEHLDNIHDVFDELIRVSKKYIIVSLPNCYATNIMRVIFGKTESRFYGLPIEKPIDRHKWFLNYNQAENFIKERSKRNNAEVVRIDPIIKKRPIRNLIIKGFYGKRANNIIALYCWAIIKKNG